MSFVRVAVQLRMNGTVMGCIMLDMVLNWFVGSNACANYSVSYGTPSMVVASTFVGWMALYLTTPRLHRSKSKYQVPLPRTRVTYVALQKVNRSDISKPKCRNNLSSCGGECSSSSTCSEHEK